MKSIILRKLMFLFIILGFILPLELKNEMVEIVTKDGNIFLGQLIEDTDEYYKLVSMDGIEINVPKTSVKEIQILNTLVREGQVLRPDPNKSMYFFAPSAFPIGDEGAYCRDFCLFFPSYNRGFGDKISVQAGAFVAPGMEVDMIPLVISAKYSLPKEFTKNIRLATGAMYIDMPDFGENDSPSLGAGISFITSTFGDNFNHSSIALGWGFSKLDSKWEFSDEPMINLAANYRMSNSFAMLFEYWKFPNVDIDYSPIMFAGRFIGRNISVDLGGIMFAEMDGLPFPLLNFTYHFSK